MVILRFKIRSKPDKSDELMSALAEIITPARATNGVINFDIARDLLDPDSFIATAIYGDGAALELQESLPEVDRVMAMLPESLVAPPELRRVARPDAGLNLLDRLSAADVPAGGQGRPRSRRRVSGRTGDTTELNGKTRRWPRTISSDSADITSSAPRRRTERRSHQRALPPH